MYPAELPSHVRPARPRSIARSAALRTCRARGTVLDPRFLVAGKIEATGEGWNWIEATGVLGVDVGWVNGNHQRILFHSVRTASADRVRSRMAAPRRHLTLVCFLHQA